jgi:hypothetical protein
MTTNYKSYKDEYTDEQLAEDVFLKTVKDINSRICPVCKTDTYVTPMQYGLVDAPDLIFIPEGEEPTEEFARVTYTCLLEGYDWDCAKCYIRF